MAARSHLGSVAAIGLLLALVAPVAPARADTVRDAQWHLSFLDIARVQQVSQGEGVTVAVLDSGVDGNHRDLAGNILPGVSLVPGYPSNGWGHTDAHGTWMAGLIAAHGHGIGGALGIAPRARILPVQIFTNASDTTTTDASGSTDSTGGDILAAGIDYAVQHGARVISMSVGQAGGSGKMRAAISHAEQAGVVLVAAVGNTDRRGKRLGVEWPARYDGVVAVAAVDRNGNRAAISVAGPEVVISAPGEEIESTSPGDEYVASTGTSASTAIVAGVAALIRAKYPALSATDVIHRLTATATDKGPKGRDDEYGYGIVNPYAALTADIPATGPTASPRTSVSASTQGSAAPHHDSKAGPAVAIAMAVVLVAGVAVLVPIAIRRAAIRSR